MLLGLCRHDYLSSCVGPFHCARGHVYLDDCTCDCLVVVVDYDFLDTARLYSNHVFDSRCEHVLLAGGDRHVDGRGTPAAPHDEHAVATALRVVPVIVVVPNVCGVLDCEWSCSQAYRRNVEDVLLVDLDRDGCPVDTGVLVGMDSS